SKDCGVRIHFVSVARIACKTIRGALVCGVWNIHPAMLMLLLLSSAAVATFNVMCGRDFITIVVIEDLFMYHSVKLEELHVGNGTCQVRRETVAGVSYMVRTPKKKYICCSGKLLEKNLTHITYSQTLQSHPNDSVLRHPAVTVEYKCAYLSICRVTLPFPIVPFSRETVIQVDAMVVFSLFTDSRYTQLRVTEPQDFFHLRVTECWASLSPSPSDANDSARMGELLGCVKDETVQGFFTGTSGLDSMNKGSPVARFRFNMFHFQTAVRKLQLHCIMWLHSLDSTVSCLQVCKPITKWEAVVEETTQGLLSYEPIRLKEPDRAGCNVLLIMELPLAGIWLLGVLPLHPSPARATRISRLSIANCINPK
uniref:Zona pellucida glycoprotein d n=1 Tax=Scleropages formosus TaxID=113540 RepID=A0A8C9RZV7_SCLFO